MREERKKKSSLISYCMLLSLFSLPAVSFLFKHSESCICGVYLSDKYFLYKEGLQLMEKPKRKQQLAFPTSPTSEDTSRGFEEDMPDEDGWVMVKKQKVTILIPPLPVTKESVMPNRGPTQLQVRSEKAIRTTSQCPVRTWSEMLAVSEKEKFMSSASEKAVPTASNFPSSQPIAKYQNPPMQDHRMGLENPQVHRFRCNKALGVCCASKVSKQSINFYDGSILLNQRMRASNLERKLQRAGGLSRWLASLGLGQFVKIFQGKRVNEFQLASLTMNKLKDMGADAVGPRRKLMHAIDCLCQPCCFEIL